MTYCGDLTYTRCSGPLARLLGGGLSFLMLFLLACGPPSLLFELLLSGCSGCEGDALSIQDVKQLAHGHRDAILLQLGLQLSQLQRLVHQDLPVQGRLGADIASHRLLCICGLDSYLCMTVLILVFTCRLEGSSKLTRGAEKNNDVM